MEESKRCTKCGEVKPLTEFSRNKNTKDGLEYKCKKCRNEYEFNRFPNRKRLRRYGESKEGFKICHTCGEEKPIEEFSKDKKRKDGLDFRCKRCSSKRGADGRKRIKHKVPEFKICCRCKIEKPISNFYKDCNKKSGHSSLCKECETEDRFNKDPYYIKNLGCEKGFKLCKKCEKIKPLEEFRKHNFSNDGYAKICKECLPEKIYKPPRVKPNDPPLGFKVCNRCKQQLPLDDFSKEKSGKYGRSGRCKKCAHEIYLIKTPNIKHAEDKYIPKEGFKVCTACGEELPIDNFNKNSRKKGGYNIYCRGCEKKNREMNKEQIRETNKKWREENIDYIKLCGENYRAINKEYLNERCRKYYKEHQEELTASKREYASTRREELAEWQREYRKTPQGKINDMIAKQKRRDLEKNLPCTLNARQWLKVLEMQNYTCYDCKKEFGKDLIPTQDHIIPVTNIWCYGLTFGNTRALCVSCNSKKHNTFKLGNAIDNLLVDGV